MTLVETTSTSTHHLVDAASVYGCSGATLAVRPVLVATKSKPKRPAPRKPAFRRLENDERRAQLLGIGRAAFAKHAYDAVSIDTLAAKAKLSKGLFYYYFPTKRDLYIAV